MRAAATFFSSPGDPRADARLASRDVRLGGRWSAGQRVKNAIIRGVVVAALQALDRVPAGWLLALGAMAGRALHLIARRMRRLTEARIAAALPGEDAPSLAHRAFTCAGRNAAVTLLLRRPGVRASDFVELCPESERALEEALAPGRGALFVSAHIGPFELIPALVVERGLPASIVVRESYDPRLDEHVDFHRCARGIEVIHRGSPTAPLAILRALRRGAPVGLLPDLGARVQSRQVPFLATVADLPTGATDLAHRLGCPMVVGTLVPGRSREFSLEIRPLPAEPRADHHACLARALSAAVARAPAHWLWMGAKSLRIADPR